MAFTKHSDKQAISFWDEFRSNIRNSTPVDKTENIIQQKKRIKELEKDVEAWFKYYFPAFSYAEPANFHKRATRRILDHPEWYEVRAWSRELAKSTRTMMEILYLTLTGKKTNVLLVSNSKDNADELLQPYQIILESNNRIINDYGMQEKPGAWETGKFTTRNNVSFRAIGAGQSPRGTKKNEARPDVILIDDIDTDQDVRNPEMIKQRWAWIEQALIGTRSVSNPMLIIFCGNIIGKYCCITEAIKKADHADIINIRDKHGKSSWPQKNTEEMINRVLSKISYISQQKEYFNNPIDEGSVFKQMYYKHLPPLSQYKFLVCYIDLSYKSSAKNDFKAAVLMGKWKSEYHLVKCWLKQGTTRELAAGLVEIQRYVSGKSALYFYAEENFMQDIIKKELHDDLKSLKANIIISSDKRKKPDKFHRIESTLEPLNTNGKFFLNEKEKDDPHMQILHDQFLALSPGSRAHDDGPDACEGAKHIIDSKIYTETPPVFGRRRTNDKRF